MLFYNEVHSPLLLFDEKNGKFLPELAKSWKHIDDQAVELRLRDDIALHSGKRFNADDGLASVSYAIDPTGKIRSRQRYIWVKRKEKLGPYTVRAHLDVPSLFPCRQLTPPRPRRTSTCPFS